MLALTHSIVGASIAKLAPTPAAGYLLAVISHPILDSIPHWDMRTRHVKRPIKKIISYSLLDASLGFILGFLLFSNLVPAEQLLITIFAAQSIDWFEAPYTVLNFKFPPFSWVKRFQHFAHQKLPFPDGLYTQLIVIFFMLLVSR